VKYNFFFLRFATIRSQLTRSNKHRKIRSDLIVKESFPVPGKIVSSAKSNSALKMQIDFSKFHGEVTGLKAVITFQGATVDEIEQAFKDSIDDYLDWCQERNVEPEKAYSEKFSLRMPPDLYVKIAAQAVQSGMSMNAYIVNKLNAA
jgi:predicted HicB family RNase H-like nuclease